MLSQRLLNQECFTIRLAKPDTILDPTNESVIINNLILCDNGLTPSSIITAALSGVLWLSGMKQEILVRSRTACF